MPPNFKDVVIVDISKWQGVVDFDILVTQADGVIIKALEGTNGIDPQFYRNKQEAIAREFPWGAYLYYKPDKDSKKQAKALAELIGTFDAVGNYTPHFTLMPVIDVEYRPSWMTKSVMFNNLTKLLLEFFRLTGIRPWIYTRKTWWEANLPTTDFDNDHKLWVAHYNKNIEEPWVPKEWEKRGYTLWQWSADGNYRGKEFGAESRHIDINYYKGGIAQLRRDFKDTFFRDRSGTTPPPPPPVEPPPPPPPPDPEPDPETPKQRTVNVYKALFTMNVRSARDISNPKNIWFSIPKGTEVEALDEVTIGNTDWVRIGQKQFVVKKAGNNIYLA